jgi:hypothetical protein
MPNILPSYRVIADTITASVDNIVVTGADMYMDSVTADNKVATIGDVNSDSSTKSYTSPDEVLYQIYQAYGGTQVNTVSQLEFTETVTVTTETINSSEISVTTSAELTSILSSISYGDDKVRALNLYINSQYRYFEIQGYNGNNIWTFRSLNDSYNFSASVGDTPQLILTHGGPAVVWWDADTLGINPDNLNDFRGAKIDYHAYSDDSGTIVGTIYIASDSGDNNVTHLETSSGANDSANVILWDRSSDNEKQLSFYRVDGEQAKTTIQWTAQLYYSPEYYD